MFVGNKKKGSAPEDMLYEIILKNSRFDLNVKQEKKPFDGVNYYVLALNHEAGTACFKTAYGGEDRA